MSLALLEKIAAHLDDAGLLTGYTKKYFRWTDADVNGAANFVLFRMAGTAGARDATVQRPDVRILLVCNATDVIAASQKADAIFANFAGITTPPGVIKLEPLGTVGGPFYMANGRGVFEIIVRCFVSDH
jgi:hypothetical protein